MNRRLVDAMAIVALVVVGALGILGGCSDGGPFETPLAAVPNSIEDPRFRDIRRGADGMPVPATPTPTPTTAGDAPPPTTVPAPAPGTTIYITKTGKSLAVTCSQGDVANCSDFGCQADAQAYFDQVRAATGQTDCHSLDQGGIALKACENSPSSSGKTQAQWVTNCL